MQGLWAGAAVVLLLACDDPEPAQGWSFFGGSGLGVPWVDADACDAEADVATPDSLVTVPTRCTNLLRCLVHSCPPPPPPPNGPIPPPPPKLPVGADAARLAQCAKGVQPVGPQAAAVVACADQHCKAPTCPAGTAANACFESCLWQACGKQLVACGTDGKAEPATPAPP